MGISDYICYVTCVYTMVYIIAYCIQFQGRHIVHIHAMTGVGWMPVVHTGERGIMTNEYCMQGGDCMICTEHRSVGGLSCILCTYSDLQLMCTACRGSEIVYSKGESNQSCTACWEGN